MAATNRVTLAFLQQHPRESARVLERLAPEIASSLFNRLDSDLVARVMATMLPAQAGQCLIRLDPRQQKVILEKMDNVRIAELLRTTEHQSQRALLSQLTIRDKVIVQRLLSFPPSTVGTIMDTPHFVLNDDITVTDALHRLQRSADMIGNEIFVIDRDHKLRGMVTPVTLMKAGHAASIKEIMDRQTPAVRPRLPLSQLISLPAWQKYRTVAVTDLNGTLLGSISYETVLEHGYQQLSDHGAATDPLTGMLKLAELYWLTIAAFIELLYSPLTAKPPATPHEKIIRGDG